MEERKSVSSHNQATENCEQDFQFSNGVTENSHTAVKQYDRNILLQLRLHPLSLQKPMNLPGMNIIKNKLYLHDIADTSTTSTEKCVDTNTFHSLSRNEHCNMKNEFSLLSHYLNRMYPYCYSSHVYNGPYQNAPLKYRSPFNTYCNSLKKHCVSNPQNYKEFPAEECIWTKRFTTSEDAWDYYSNHYSNASKKKEPLEAVPKRRKKLQIIDPLTGKNVLEAVAATQHEQSDSDCVEESSKSSENYMTDMPGEKYSGDYFCNAENSDASMHEPNEDSEDSVLLTSEERRYYEEQKNPNDMHEPALFAKTERDNSNSDETSESMSALTAIDIKDENHVSRKDGSIMSTFESSEVPENAGDLMKIAEKVPNYEIPKCNKKALKMDYNRETCTHIGTRGTNQPYLKKEDNLHLFNENIVKPNESMRESLRQLREKVYSLKQEQQKMAILQSFLRYKKYQLEESARNLDEKRIEIANWECNLYNKAKKLHDKELWLESKNDTLCNKAQQLAEKEKVLNDEECKFSIDIHFSKNIHKETQLRDKNFAFESNNAEWDEISKIKDFRNPESNEYSLPYGSNPNKASGAIKSDTEKYKSDACSLDELERNIVLIEKMHCCSEMNDNTVDKIEIPSSSSIQRKDENASHTPIGYSKGRRYLPEHIKYWLNQRDKNTL